jgi:hypothetical protein
MLHFVARALPGTLLFRDNIEALALWERLIRAVPMPAAMCLMPNHVHALYPREVRRQLGVGLGAYARWRNHQRGEHGSVWVPIPEPHPVLGAQKRARNQRYIHLNPCRAGLVSDPLEWAWSTHRDAVALAVRPVRPPARDARRFHAYVSADPDADVRGTPLPVGVVDALERTADLRAVRDAVSAVTRAPLPLLEKKGPSRRLLVQAARVLSSAGTSEIAEFVGLRPRAVRRIPAQVDDDVQVVARVLGDPRFRGLHDRDLRVGRAFSQYRRCA